MEHSILLIKPDGVELGIEKQCEEIIAKYNLDIVKKKYLKVYMKKNFPAVTDFAGVPMVST